MISRRGGEVLLALLLILSLLLKISGVKNAQAEGSRGVYDRVATVLERHGFKVVKNATDEDLFSLSGLRGQCRLLVAVLSPHGWHRDVIRQIAPPDSQLLFLFDGASYRDQPLLLTRLDYYWSRLLRYAGINQPLRPVLGVVGSSECELDEILKWEVWRPCQSSDVRQSAPSDRQGCPDARVKAVPPTRLASTRSTKHAEQDGEVSNQLTGIPG